MQGDRLILYVIYAAVMLFLLWLMSCTSQPSCVDNPRNMRCMSAAQLEKELSK